MQQLQYNKGEMNTEKNNGKKRNEGSTYNLTIYEQQNDGIDIN